MYLCQWWDMRNSLAGVLASVLEHEKDTVQTFYAYSSTILRKSAVEFFLVCQERFRNLNFHAYSYTALDLRQFFFLVCQERFRNLNFDDNSSPALDLRQFFFWFAKNGSGT